MIQSVINGLYVGLGASIVFAALFFIFRIPSWLKFSFDLGLVSQLTVDGQEQQFKDNVHPDVYYSRWNRWKVWSKWKNWGPTNEALLRHVCRTLSKELFEDANAEGNGPVRSLKFEMSFFRTHYRFAPMFYKMNPCSTEEVIVDVCAAVEDSGELGVNCEFSVPDSSEPCRKVVFEKPILSLVPYFLRKHSLRIEPVDISPKDSALVESSGSEKTHAVNVPDDKSVRLYRKDMGFAKTFKDAHLLNGTVRRRVELASQTEGFRLKDFGRIAYAYAYFAAAITVGTISGHLLMHFIGS